MSLKMWERQEECLCPCSSVLPALGLSEGLSGRQVKAFKWYAFLLCKNRDLPVTVVRQKQPGIKHYRQKLLFIRLFFVCVFWFNLKHISFT